MLEYNEIQLLYSQNVTQYRSRNNGMLQNDLQTDLDIYIPYCFETFR